MSGYTQTQEVVSTFPAATSSSGRRAAGVGHSGSSVRATQLSSLHTCTAFLAALTNPDADGRIIVEPGIVTGGGGCRGKGCGSGSLPAGKAGKQGPTVGGTGLPTGGAGCGGRGMEEGPSLKFVLLNAAAHFSKVSLNLLTLPECLYLYLKGRLPSRVAPPPQKLSLPPCPPVTPPSCFRF